MQISLVFVKGFYSAVYVKIFIHYSSIIMLNIDLVNRYYV